MRMEHKSLALDVKELDEDGVFEGYGAVFGNVDAWNDIIRPGAFKASIKAHKDAGSMPKLLWQHDQSEPLGPWLSVDEDEKGLIVRGQLLKDDVRRAREAYALLKSRALDGMSIGYLARDYSVDQKTGIRTLKRVDLLEISLVTFPANEQARVTGVKGGGPRTIRDFEAALRDELGFSWREAKHIARYGFKAPEEPGHGRAATIIKEIIEHNKGAFK